MCGFAGVIDLDRPPDPEVVRAMGALLRHRGPDDEGCFRDAAAALMALRLAIIDPSPAGRQPMESADGRHVIAFNGAVYNYVELREELRARGRLFRTGTDTEVLLEAFAEWGLDALPRLNGMFAFAVWDRRERRLVCARDRFGVKPLYYRASGRSLAVASEIKALLVRGASPPVNEERLYDLLARRKRDHTGDTLFRGVSQLEPAHALTFDDDGVRLRRWWEPPLDGPPAGEEDAPSAVRDVLRDAVRLRLRSDVPVGTCLSGGVDSSAVVCLASELLADSVPDARSLGAEQRTFTAAFPGEAIDERSFADEVAAAAHARASFCAPEAPSLELLERIVWHHDEPLLGASVVAQWHVMELARAGGVTVLLDGQGSDELFAGYEAFAGFRVADLLRAGRPRAAWATASRFLPGRHWNARSLAAATARAFLRVSVETRLRERLDGVPRWIAPDLPRPEPMPRPPARDLLHAQLGLVIRDELPSLLHNEDRNSMAFSLEARAPFLDVRLAELALRLPSEWLVADGEAKVVLRQALRGIVPHRVLARRDKLGFPAPERSWLVSRAQEVAELLGGRFEQRGIVRPEALRRARRQLLAGRPHPALWRWLCVELWFRQFIDGDRPRLDRFAAPSHRLAAR